ncbi:unnamed protein product [Toxocara canis]|uniref:Uncharacterized protein n=1 Tax=Toxocara canis TaxID=6265 RepID=A0A183UFW9_TOXCA|nr:unnamed protein product [Toxocara canis]
MRRDRIHEFVDRSSKETSVDESGFNIMEEGQEGWEQRKGHGREGDEDDNFGAASYRFVFNTMSIVQDN